MNDIDLRCDAYLSWLHDRRSSREPFLKELAVLGGAAAGILRATEVGATPIALTAIAFGLAADTFTNVDLRLLNGVDYTTVQSVVRGNRTQFRLNNLNLVIDNRPAAIYVLRNYLSICVPASIEMSINNTINVYHRGGPAALQELQIGLRNPVATSATSASVRGTPVVIRTDRPPPDAPPLPAIMAGAIGPVETAISVTSGMALQRSLCVADSGEFDSATRAELRNFKAASLYPSDGSVTDRLTVDSDLRNLRAAQKKFPSCRAAGFLSGFEVGLFSRFGTTKMRDDLKRALIAANLPVPASFNASPAQPMDDTARQVISSLGTKYGLTGQSVIDRPFYEKMLNSLVR
jgi:hypothetical protein